MRTTSRSTRRTTAAQPFIDKENRRDTVTTPGRKVRHRLTTTELARLEDTFAKDTHPSRQQKKALAVELGMDYKTVTIWFQNKRQTSKRGRPANRSNARTRADSCLRAVSSPSQNTTLDASEVSPAATPLAGKGPAEGLNAMACKAMVKIRPLLDSLNALTWRPREHVESAEATDEAPNVNDVDPFWSQTQSEISFVSAEQEHAGEQPVKRKRIRTLEWACERQSKRRKSNLKLGSEEDQDWEPSDAHMDSALSLLSLASATQVGPPNDVVRGASLLLSFKHSWRRR